MTSNEHPTPLAKLILSKSRVSDPARTLDSGWYVSSVSFQHARTSTILPVTRTIAPRQQPVTGTRTSLWASTVEDMRHPPIEGPGPSTSRGAVTISHRSRMLHGSRSGYSFRSCEHRMLRSGVSEQISSVNVTLETQADDTGRVPAPPGEYSSTPKCFQVNHRWRRGTAVSLWALSGWQHTTQCLCGRNQD